jgi:diaminohydroxyphosphoribosylaminopyrimidine deaminase/5-amino-6-(5-phosphoribosylamino)uracil reductase
VGVTYRDSVSDGQINLHGLLQELWNAGHTSILVEGGPETIRRFADTGLVDRVDLFVNPILLGDGVPAPMDCLNLSFLKVRETRIFGDDVYTSYWVDKS